MNNNIMNCRRSRNAVYTILLSVLFFMYAIHSSAQVNSNGVIFKTFYDSGWTIKDSNAGIARQLLHRMDSLAKHSNDPKQTIQAMQLRAYLTMPTDLTLALDYIHQAIQRSNESSIHQYDGRHFYVLGSVFKGLNLDSATYYLEASYRLSGKVKDSLCMKSALTKMSFVAMEQGDFVKALKYLQTCERLFSKSRPREVVISMINQSHALLAVGLEERAIMLARRGIELAFHERYEGYETHVINLYGNLIESLVKINKPLEAYGQWRKMITQIPKVEAFREYSQFMLGAGELYLALDSPALALSSFTGKNSPTHRSYRKLAGMFHAYGKLGDHKNEKELAMTLTNNIPTVSGDVGRTEIFRIAAQAFAFLEMHDSAYHYHKLYFENYRRLYNQRQLASILQDDFDEQLTLQKSNAEMEKAMMQSEIRYTKQRSFFLIAVAALLALIAVLLFRGYRSVKKFNSLLNQRVQERTAELTEKNQQLTEYAFINAHQLRGPVARILGLLNLAMNDQHKIAPDNLVDMLKSETESLDNIVKTITKAIEEKRVISRHDIG